MIFPNKIVSFFEKKLNLSVHLGYSRKVDGEVIQNAVIGGAMVFIYDKSDKKKVEDNILKHSKEDDQIIADGTFTYTNKQNETKSVDCVMCYCAFVPQFDWDSLNLKYGPIQRVDPPKK